MKNWIFFLAIIMLLSGCASQAPTQAEQPQQAPAQIPATAPEQAAPAPIAPTAPAEAPQEVYAEPESSDPVPPILPEEPAEQPVPAPVASPLGCILLTSADITSVTGRPLISQDGPTISPTDCSIKWIIGESAAFSGMISLSIKIESNAKTQLDYVCKEDLGIGDYKSCKTAGGVMFGKGDYLATVACFPGVKTSCTQDNAIELAKTAAGRFQV